MKVMVDSNFRIAKVFEPPVEFDLHGASPTLRDVLAELDARSRSVQFLLKTGAVGDDVDEILLNDTPYKSLPQGIMTPVNEHDTVMVQISMGPLGDG